MSIFTKKYQYLFEQLNKFGRDYGAYVMSVDEDFNRTVITARANDSGHIRIIIIIEREGSIEY